MRLPDTITLNLFSDVESAKHVARLYANSIGLSELSASEVVLGVSEIASNVIRHAHHGLVHFKVLDSKRGIRIIITDSGSGIEDISAASEDGYSTIKHSLGIGLGVSKRAFDYFNIKSLPHAGTEVIVEKYLPIPKSVIDYGYISIKDQHYELNGDLVTTHAYHGDTLLAAVIDGAGQGYVAHEIAARVSFVISQVFKDSLANIIVDCDDALSLSSEDGGATITLIRMTRNQLEIIGIGDTHTYLVREGKTSPILHHIGRIGMDNLPQLRLKTITLQKGDTLISCTDGIKSLPSNLTLIPHNSSRNQAIQIFNRYHRALGDATALVIKYHGYDE